MTGSLQHDNENVPDMDHYVSYTAFVACFYRKMENSLTTYRLFHDPVAEKMLPEGFEDTLTRDGVSSWWCIGKKTAHEIVKQCIRIRHRFFNDKIAEYLCKYKKEGRTPQFVNMGCGLDGRAFYNIFPKETVIYEVDRKEVLEYKQQCVEGLVPKVKRVVVPCDIVEDDWQTKLVEKGFQVNQPTVWLAEGVLLYMPKEKVKTMLSTMAELSESGSFVAVDAVSSLVLQLSSVERAREHLEEQGSSLQFGVDFPERFLKSCGWNSPEVFQMGDMPYGDWPILNFPRWIPFVPRFWLMTATVEF